MITSKSATQSLREALNQLTADIEKWLLSIPVKWLNRNHPNIVIVTPEFYWGDLTPEQANLQITLMRRYDLLMEVIRVLFSGASKETIKSLDDADKQMRVWLELEPSWSLSREAQRNIAAFEEDVTALRSILAILDAVGTQDLVLVPDTNSLLLCSDPCAYRAIVGQDAFTFLLLPTILGELDHLKILHRNEAIRDKAKKVIRRIKGWRAQGSLHAGVTIDGTITVKGEYREPSMSETLPWLDAGVPDDRLIASVLSVQANSPCSCVVLVTGDINLQNKAEAAFIEIREITED